MITRIAEMPGNHSFFLFGPRQTGKSSLIRAKFGDNSWTVNILRGDGIHAYRKDGIRVIPWKTFLDEVRQEVKSS